MTPTKCEDCDKLKEELRNSNIAIFLHDHIDDVHLADTLLDYINMLEERLSYVVSKIRYKHLRKVLKLKRS